MGRVYIYIYIYIYIYNKDVTSVFQVYQSYITINASGIKALHICRLFCVLPTKCIKENSYWKCWLISIPIYFLSQLYFSAFSNFSSFYEDHWFFVLNSHLVVKKKKRDSYKSIWMSIHTIYPSYPVFVSIGE